MFSKGNDVGRDGCKERKLAHTEGPMETSRGATGGDEGWPTGIGGSYLEDG